MNEEAQKRSTDCVYFLASPLTCKKGNDCEYRHSEAARINPRDCYFWLTGTCLNANCTFRHPPLDGRLGPTQTSTPVQTAPSSSAAAISAASPAVSKASGVPSAANKSAAALSPASKPVQAPAISGKPSATSPTANKSKTPCFFFSQGYCAKGDRCPFLHGQPAAQSIEAAVYKRPPKAPIPKGIENDKPMTLIRGSSSSANKEAPQGLPVPLERRSVSQTETRSVSSKVTAPACEVAVPPSDGERARIPDSSMTSAPARHRIAISDDKARISHGLSDRSWPVQMIGDRARQAQPGENRMQQPRPGNQRQWQRQKGEDKLRQSLPGEERKQNGFEPEEWWKESLSTGLDVHTDRGPDRLIFTGENADVPYHNADSVKNRSGGRMIRPDGLTEFQYEVPQHYDQSGYYATSGLREHGPREYQEQEAGHDHRGTSERMVGQHSLSYNARSGDIGLARDIRGMNLEQEMQHGSGDLRHHLSKRRRSERSHLTADSSNRKTYQDASNYHKRRHDEHLKQEISKLNQVSSQQVVRSNHRRPSGRLDPGGVKRAHHELGSDYGSVSPDRPRSKSSPSKRPVNDPSRLKLRDADSGWHASDAASTPEAGSYTTSNSKKAEQKKESSNFAGPKSLAQIKAEKRRAEAENGFKAVDSLEYPKEMSGTVNFADQQPLMVIKSQISLASDSDVDQVHRGRLSEDIKNSTSNELIKSQDLEAPKSLSISLKAKQKPGVDGDDVVEETKNDAVLRRISIPSAGGDKSEANYSQCLSLGTSKALEDGEVLPDTNNATFYSEVVNGGKQSHSDSPEQDLSEVPVNASGYSGKEKAADEVQRNLGEKAESEMLSYEDIMEDGMEAGGNASDEEFSSDDDEESDDFRKKLRGYFSEV